MESLSNGSTDTSEQPDDLTIRMNPLENSDGPSSDHSIDPIIRKDTLSDIHMKYSKTDSVWRQKKWIFIIAVFVLNLSLIVATVFTKAGFYIIIPFITLSHFRDIIYIFVAIFGHLFRKHRARWGKHIELEKIDQFKPIVLCSIVTCYSEHYPTVKETVESLLSTKSSHNIINLVMCVCDGAVVGKENDKPLATLFEEDMVEFYGEPIGRTYETWKGDIVRTKILYGKLTAKQDSIFVLVQKLQNNGKKDSLLLAKGIIKDLNDQKGKLRNISRHLPDTIKYVFCTDADTLIGDRAIERAVLCMEQYPELDANVSQLRVRFHKRSWFWDPLQHFQYFSSQFVRRMCESVMGKVTCLSGSGNVCRVSSEAYQYANIRYAEYPRTTSIMDVVPKMIGTDRRYVNF